MAGKTGGELASLKHAHEEQWACKQHVRSRGQLEGGDDMHVAAWFAKRRKRNTHNKRLCALPIQHSKRVLTCTHSKNETVTPPP